MIKILNKVIDKLDKDETIILSLECSIRTFVYRQVYRPGVMVATNKKLLFYGLNLGDIEFVEMFEYENISSVEEKKGIFKNSIIIYNNGESIKLSNILSQNTSEFLEVVKNKIGDNSNENIN